MGCGSSATATPVPNTAATPKRKTVSENASASVPTQPVVKIEEIPTPRNLAQIQRLYASKKISVQFDEHERPLPFPTTTPKKDIFKIDAYKDIDACAIKTCTSLTTTSFEELVNHLTHKAKTELAKVRAIFRWITAQDFGREDPKFTYQCENGPASYLRNIQHGAGDYPGLFIRMCNCAQIPCKRISGSVKGVSYCPGDDIKHAADDTSDRHHGSWIAVFIAGCWRLIDPHWASRHVVEKNETDWSLVDGGTNKKNPSKTRDAQHTYTCDELYFLTDPYDFIVDHFPYDPRWQLLAREVSLDEFKQMANLKKHFFYLDLFTITHHKCVVQAYNGEVEIKIGMPPGLSCKFTYNLHVNTADHDKAIDAKVMRYVYMESRDGILRIKIDFPLEGKYRLDIFGKDDSNESNVLYELICYLINCTQAKQNARAVPITSRGEWGPGSDLENIGLVPITHKEGDIQVNADGSTDIRFKSENTAATVQGVLTSDTIDKDTLKHFIVQRSENGEVIFNIKPPEKGDYTLGIFGNADGNAKTMLRVCDYLIRCEEGTPDKTPFPTMAQGRIGEEEPCSTFGLVRKTHKPSFIIAPPGGELECVLATTKDPMEFHTQFVLQEAETSVTYNEYAYHEQTKDEVKFVLVFPKPGIYLLRIFGRPKQMEGHTMPQLQDYFILNRYYKPSIQAFPTTTPLWGVGCQLIEPRNGNLPPNTTIKFAMRVPNVKDIAVVKGKKWTHLKSESDVWTADVETGIPGVQLDCVAATSDGTSFNNILTYKVMTELEVEEMKKVHANADALYKTNNCDTSNNNADGKRGVPEHIAELKECFELLNAQFQQLAGLLGEFVKAQQMSELENADSGQSVSGTCSGQNTSTVSQSIEQASSGQNSLALKSVSPAARVSGQSAALGQDGLSTEQKTLEQTSSGQNSLSLKSVSPGPRVSGQEQASSGQNSLAVKSVTPGKRLAGQTAAFGQDEMSGQTAQSSRTVNGESKLTPGRSAPLPSNEAVDPMVRCLQQFKKKREQITEEMIKVETKVENLLSKS